jgi:3-(3-hydroxy-phenyl)propionate hydroxylase
VAAQAGSVADRYDVAIVGYGPVGAILAGLLGLRGHRVIVFDREVGLYPRPRAAHIDHMGLRVLQQLGSLNRLLPEMLLNPGTEAVTVDGEVLFRLPSDGPSPSGLPASMYFYQPVFDGELRRRVGELPNVTVKLATDVTDFVDDDGHVRVKAIDRADDAEWFDADWLVGCDGAGSTVRQRLGIERESFGFEEQWVIFDLQLGSPRPPLPLLAVQVCDPRRPRTELPMPQSRFRFEFMVMPGEDATEMLRPEVARERLLAPLLPEESATIERTATYTFFGAVATTYRKDHVFLAGDAAHLMPPFLGQGMCSGIRDAQNLAWKLDRVIRGLSGDDLLNTYETERRPHVSQVIQVAVDFGRIICVTDPVEAEQRNRRFLEDPRPLEERFRFRLPELTQGPLVLEGGGAIFPQPPAVDGAGLDDWVGARFMVLARDEASLGDSADLWSADPDVVVCTLDEVPDPSGAVRAWFERNGAGVVVVRPDRYILGTADKLDTITERLEPLLVSGNHR